MYIISNLYYYNGLANLYSNLTLKETIMEKKFELVEDGDMVVRNSDGEAIKLYRIKALKTFSCPIKLSGQLDVIANFTVEKGTLGGWVENEDNLSHEGGCWIFENARVYDDARIEDNAQIHHSAIVDDGAVVKDYASVVDRARVTRGALVGGCTKVANEAEVSDSKVVGDIDIFGRSQVYKGSNLSGRIYLEGTVVVEGAEISNDLNLSGSYHITFNTKSNEDVATYHTTKAVTTVSAINQELNRCCYVTAATKEDVWNVFPFNGTGSELIKFVEKNYPSSLEYYRNLVAFHRQQYGL